MKYGNSLLKAITEFETDFQTICRNKGIIYKNNLSFIIKHRWVGHTWVMRNAYKNLILPECLWEWYYITAFFVLDFYQLSVFKKS
jgi:hypothetical protein